MGFNSAFKGLNVVLGVTAHYIHNPLSKCLNNYSPVTGYQAVASQRLE